MLCTMKTKSYRQVLLTGVVIVSTAWWEMHAQEAPGEPDKSHFMKFLEQDYMLGTWGGTRTNLAAHGVDFEFLYFGALPSNVRGGIRVGSEWEGALLMALNLDSEKLLNYKGGTLYASSLYVHNTREFSRTHIGDLNKVSLLDFPDTFRLWELYYEHKLFDGRLSLKLGQLAIDRDFILPEFYNSLASITFLNQTFFYPTLAFNVYDIAGLPPGHHALASTPYGAPGARVRIDPNERWMIQAGAYDGNPDRGFSGTRVNLNDKEGALLYFEFGYRHNQARNEDKPKGNYKLGAFYHTDDFQDINQAVLVAFGAIPGPAEQHGGNYGFYFLADQQLFREIGKDDPASQGLVGFFRVAVAPDDRNLTQLGIDGGLVYKGLIPGRDWDTLGVAGSYLEMSDDFARAFSAVGLPEPDYEAVIEISYKAQLTAWWTLQPSLQYVFHPGGGSDPTRSIDDALAIILQTVFRF